MSSPRVLAIVLAGGEGKRLMPLTADRAKPAVPFGGSYRLIDFALSNVANAGYLQVVVLTQYKSHSLDKHISMTWRMSTMLGNYVTPVPAQQRVGKNWYLGSADAIYQSLNLIDDARPDIVVVVGADHVYRMDFSQMVDAHVASGAGCSVAAIRQPVSLADQFGVIEVGSDVDMAGTPRITAFREKPSDPTTIPGSPGEVLASMGNYVFDAAALVDAVTRDAATDSKHDMGGDIVPDFVSRGDAAVYDFQRNDVPGTTDRDRAYWRDVGTLDSYYEAHMDLISPLPVFNLYNGRWPILSQQQPLPPAKFVHGDDGSPGSAVDSIVAPGVVLSGATVSKSVLSPGVRAETGSTVSGSVLLDGVHVGRGATVRRAILDKNVVVPDGASVGVDAEADRARGFTVTPSGITVAGKNARVDR
ncbi:glucose-1-phosphate adenylyltransferase [Pseudokineococcus lusitanus]|uniref:Glucose-1-phosphate adenylyltransferase n=1 Tax=Pseudokineococcus lusitanus TaxID=763993 RepID=A0A3N1HSG0_9ACTN|nr:glucose-1-phosphate adenylyltransferase [Pseudokineococcus lusitanus]ROP45474.1 glucose-1-phosphate adenylyltransferase [Pseudokineococcus lusitanus]